MAGRPVKAEWDHFQEVEWNEAGKCTKIQCLYCRYKAAAHGTRIAHHYRKYHAGKLSASRDSDESESGRSTGPASASSVDSFDAVESLEPPKKKTCQV